MTPLVVDKFSLELTNRILRNYEQSIIFLSFFEQNTIPLLFFLSQSKPPKDLNTKHCLHPPTNNAKNTYDCITLSD